MLRLLFDFGGMLLAQGYGVVHHAPIQFVGIQAGSPLSSQASAYHYTIPYPPPCRMELYLEGSRSKEEQVSPVVSEDGLFIPYFYFGVQARTWTGASLPYLTVWESSLPPKISTPSKPPGHLTRIATDFALQEVAAPQVVGIYQGPRAAPRSMLSLHNMALT